MGNIVGEKFDDFVLNQINARQNLYGSGFKNEKISSSQLLLLNNRNAWLKLASSVDVFNKQEHSFITDMDATPKQQELFRQQLQGMGLGTQRLIDIEIGAGDVSNYLGPKFAQRAVLFNTLSDITNKDKYITRSGVTTSSTNLWNNNSYGLGGGKFGLVPAPGLISAKIDNQNRGSIRKATIEIKAFNQFQFEMIELLYLRLGFTMMLEWGWDKYLNQKGVYTNMGNTIIEDSWFNSSTSSQLDMLNKIQNKRAECAGNYDGFFGKVVNFDWNFNKNGSYDITLKLITLGDVIESIKSKPNSVPLTVTKISQLINTADAAGDDEQLEKLEKIKDSTIVTMAGSNPISQGLYADIIESSLWEKDSSKNFFSFNSIKELTEEFLTKKRTSTFRGLAGSALRAGIDKLQGNEVEEIKADDIIATVAEVSKINDDFLYYMTFSEFLNRLQQYTIPSIGSNKNTAQKQLFIDIDIDTNLCSAYPNQISFDPKICLIRPIITNSMIRGQSASVDDKNWWDKLKEFGFLEDKLLYGKVMNIYLNYKFISDCLSENMDKDGNISIYKLITRVCEGINSSLGNIQQIEAVIRDEINITIQDQNPIPGLELKFPDIATTNIAPFEIFGFNTSGSASSNFVTDFSFNTKITPQLASMISIGTTANNISTKNYDGTVFSKWNSGLQDRYAAFYSDPTPTIKPTLLPYLTLEQRVAEERAWEDSRLVQKSIFNPLTGEQRKLYRENIVSPYYGNRIWERLCY